MLIEYINTAVNRALLLLPLTSHSADCAHCCPHRRSSATAGRREQCVQYLQILKNTPIYKRFREHAQILE